jgi:hypothetical protein
MTTLSPYSVGARRQISGDLIGLPGVLIFYFRTDLAMNYDFDVIDVAGIGVDIMGNPAKTQKEVHHYEKIPNLDGVIERLIERLQREHPGMRIDFWYPTKDLSNANK